MLSCFQCISFIVLWTVSSKNNRKPFLFSFKLQSDLWNEQTGSCFFCCRQKALIIVEIHQFESSLVILVNLLDSVITGFSF